SFDHLVGNGEHVRRNGKADRLGGLEVHGHLVFRWKLDRKIAGLGATQNAIDISAGATKGFYHVSSITGQTSISRKVRSPIGRRNVVSGRREYYRRAMCEREHIRHDDKAASRLPPKADDGCFDFYVAMNWRRDWYHLE